MWLCPGLVGVGEGGNNDSNQEYRKRNKSVGVDNDCSSAYVAFEMSSEHVFQKAWQKRPKGSWNKGAEGRSGVGGFSTNTEIISRHLIVEQHFQRISWVRQCAEHFTVLFPLGFFL